MRPTPGRCHSGRAERDEDGRAAAFDRVLASDPDDRAAAHYRERALRLAAEGVPPGWTGVEAMESK